MKFPSVPVPEPAWMITVTRGPAWSRRVVAQALRFALWGIPSVAVEYVLATADHGRHALWLTIAAAWTTIAIAVLTVNARPGSEEGSS